MKDALIKIRATHGGKVPTAVCDAGKQARCSPALKEKHYSIEGKGRAVVGRGGKSF